MESCIRCNAVVASPKISFCPECLLELFSDEPEVLDVSEPGDFDEDKIPVEEKST
jgi:hypothetical protein